MSLLGYTPVKGDIVVHLAEDVNTNDYSAPYVLTYTGMYKSGQGRTGSIQVSDEVMTMQLHPTQTITFIVNKRTSDKITGTYTSDTPADRGEFELTRT